MEKEQNDLNFTITEIWLEYEPYIKKLCAYKLKSIPGEIDDCVQEVFLAFFDVLNKGQQIEHPKAWLTTVANNKINDLYKAVKKENDHVIPLSHEEAINYISTFNETESILSVSDEQIDTIKEDVLKQLTEEERQFIEEYYVQNKKLKTIARNHQYTESKMKKVMFYLRKKIISLSKSELKKHSVQNIK